MHLLPHIRDIGNLCKPACLVIGGLFPPLRLHLLSIVLENHILPFLAHQNDVLMAQSLASCPKKLPKRSIDLWG